MTEVVIDPKPAPGRNRHGRRDLPSEVLAEIGRQSANKTATISARIQTMIRDRLRHVAEHIPAEGPDQVLVLDDSPAPPFFTVTTREKKE